MGELLKVPKIARRSWTVLVTLILVTSGAAIINKPEADAVASANDQTMSEAVDRDDAFEMAILTAEAQFKDDEAMELSMLSAEQGPADAVSFVANDRREPVENVSFGEIIDDEKAEVFNALTLSGLDRSTVTSLIEQGKAAIFLRTNTGDYVATSASNGYNIQASQRSTVELSQLEITDPEILATFPKSLMEYQLRLHGANAMIDSMAIVFTANMASEMMQARETTGGDKGATGCFNENLRFVSGESCLAAN